MRPPVISISGHPPPGSDNLIGLTLEMHLHATSGHQYLGTDEPCYPGLTVEEPFRSPSGQQPLGLLTIATLAGNRAHTGTCKPCWLLTGREHSLKHVIPTTHQYYTVSDPLSDCLTHQVCEITCSLRFSAT
jgi:hypothetical protein